MESPIRGLIVPLCEQLTKQLTAFADAHPDQRPDLLTIELLVAKVLARMAVALVAGLILLWHGRGVEAAGVGCAGCGARMRVQGYQRRALLSCWAPVSYERAFYYCRACHRRRTPLDERLGVAGRTLSPRLQRLVAYLAAHLSFGTVERATSEACDVGVSAETTRQVAAGVGAEARGWEERRRQPIEGAMPEASRRPPKTWVVECDGKQVGFRDGRWQEVKIGVIYEAGARVETREGRDELLKRELLARRCGWEEFAAHFWVAMRRAGVRAGDRLVAVADGAHATEQVFSFVAPEAQRVRDSYHVAERIHAIGEVRFGAESTAAKQWAQARLHKLKGPEAASVIRSIAHLKLDTRQAEETRRQVLGYSQHHRAAMDYARYKAEGWPIGSGAVEGGCRLIGARTNGCGRRWGESGCDSVVALRVAVLNERLDLIRPRPQVELGLAA